MAKKQQKVEAPPVDAEKKTAVGDMHRFNDSEIMKRKQKKLNDTLVNFRKTLDKTRPESTGITAKQINGFKGE